MASDKLSVYGQTLPGVEEIAWLEIRDKFPLAVFKETLFAKEQNGIVIFDYPGPITDLLQLRTTEDVFLHALSIPKVSRDWRDLRLIADQVQKSPEFGRAIDNVVEQRKGKGAPSYRIISRKYGSHQYRRKDLEQSVAKGMKIRFPKWRPVADNAQIEIWVNLLGSRVLIGVRLSDRKMRHRYKKTLELKGSLRPSVAAAMIHLTQPEPGDRFLDAMCGSGTLLLERQFAGAYGQIVGGDIQSKRANIAWDNLSTQRKDILEKEITVCHWDASRLPFADGSIDKVATNLPFGKQMSSQKELQRLYPAFFTELERIMRPNGKAAILSSEYDLVKDAIRQREGLSILGGYSVSILGQWARIYLVERS